MMNCIMLPCWHPGYGQVFHDAPDRHSSDRALRGGPTGRPQLDEERPHLIGKPLGGIRHGAGSVAHLTGGAVGLIDGAADGGDVRCQLCVPDAASWTLCEISRVAAPCCSTALAIAVVTWSIWRIAAPTSLTDATALPVEVWMP
jgi:hypothetical protein